MLWSGSCTGFDTVPVAGVVGATLLLLTADKITIAAMMMTSATTPRPQKMPLFGGAGACWSWLLSAGGFGLWFGLCPALPGFGLFCGVLIRCCFLFSPACGSEPVQILKY